MLTVSQEINIALASERPIQVSIEQCNVDMSFRSGSEGTWACRSIIHCAAVVHFCFNSEAQSSERWKHLVEYNLEWMKYKPRSFDPLYRHYDATTKVPEIIFMEDIHSEYSTIKLVILWLIRIPTNSNCSSTSHPC